jgi:AcrR family transcriptional regulator
MAVTGNDDNRDFGASRRVRRAPERSRQLALDAAHKLLITAGPTAVTLKSVAKATGMTHGNITHHFGSVTALHAALISRMAEELSTQANEAVMRLRLGEIDAPDVVDLVFAAFVDTGCGRLIGWLSATGEQEALSPVFDALSRSVQTYREGEPSGAVSAERGAGPIALELLSHALTASLIGERLESATAMPAGSLRSLAVAQLSRLRAT